MTREKLLHFKKIIREATIKAKGDEASRHVEKYVKPFLKKKNTHTLAKDIENISKGSSISIKSYIEKDGVHYVRITHPKLKKPVTIAVSLLNKPQVDDNKGTTYERELIKILKLHGIMDKNSEGAGNGAGNDFHILDARGRKHKGRSIESHTGETKASLQAAFGQITIHYTTQKGWHISDKAREHRSKFAYALEKATITVNGKQKNFLKYLNTAVGPPTKYNISTNVYSDRTTLQPIHDYLSDHNVGILHIGTHGTYRAGNYQKKDLTDVGFPEAVGEGIFRARFRKNRPGMFIEFKPKAIEKSHLDLMNSDHIKYVSKKLGLKK